jgi:acetolactate decarboxylase
MKRTMVTMFDAALAAAVHRQKERGAQRGALADPRGVAHGHIQQTEVLSDLFEGHFEAVTTVGNAFAEILLGPEHGNGVGLGVAEAADGEIVAFDGDVWRIPMDGLPVPAEASLGLPFVIVADGGDPLIEELPAGLDFAGVTEHIDALLRRLDRQDGHLVAAIRIDGVFNGVLMRSEPRQTPPYPKLTAVLEHESQFEFTEWSGTLVGFRFPDINDGIVIPGLHLHGVSTDRLSGGHCHRATVSSATMRIWLDDVDVRIPALPVVDALREGA